MEFKICTMCNISKSLDNFYIQKQYDKGGDVIKIKYFAECKECNKKRNTDWNKENPERRKEIMRKFDASEERKILQNKHKEKRYAGNRNWKKNNPEYMKNYMQARRNKMLELPYDFTIEDWEYAKEYFNCSCAYCGDKENDNIKLEQDHFIAMSKGGGYTKFNIIPACRTCNSSKHNNDFLEWYEKQLFYNESNVETILNYFEGLEDMSEDYKYKTKDVI